MKNTNVIFCLVIVFCMLTCLYLAASIFNQPLDFSCAQTRFENHKTDILLISDFMVKSNFENIYFFEKQGRIIADFEELVIEQISIKNAIDRLITNGDFLEISKEGDTLIFEMWNGSLDVGCGVAYSINCNNAPEIQFQTELIPLGESGWYYYIYDYNKWRTLNGN